MNCGMAAMATQVFKISRQTFATAMVRQFGLRWIFALGVVVCIPAAISLAYDLRWLVVALIFLLLVGPMMFAFLYFHHGLKKLSVANVVDHKLEFFPDRLKITIYAQTDQPEAADDDFGERRLYSYDLDYSRISKIDISMSGIVICVDNGKEGILCIPTGAFAGEHEFSRAMDRMINGIRHKSQIDSINETFKRQ